MEAGVGRCPSKMPSSDEDAQLKTMGILGRGGHLGAKQLEVLPFGQVLCMMPKMSQILDSIRDAIEAGDTTRYRIAQDTGIAESVLSRLVNGERGIKIETAEILADYLGLEITIKPKRRRKGK